MSVSLDEVAFRENLRKASQDYRASVFNIICSNIDNCLTGAELFDSDWSDSDSFNDVEDDSSSKKACVKNEDKAEIANEIKPRKETDQGQRTNNGKVRKIAEELLKTEQDYVNRLHLLHEVFFLRLDSENKERQMFPPEILSQMFMNIRSIYLFHHDFLLPQLQDRINNWNENPRIGDLMKQNAPFLKMYSEYIRNFDQAMRLINQWMEKSTRFMNIIKEIQRLPECGQLSLQHHMLGPIQRVPRYELLLKDYIKQLPHESPDLSDANDALELVAKASSHSNEALKKTEKFCQLLDIYQSLRGVAVDFISPTRELKASGQVVKISARTGEKQNRHLFLFSDLLLICSLHMRCTYNVRNQMELESLEVKGGSQGHLPSSFTLHSKQKTVELVDENQAGEAFGWEEKIRELIEAQRERKRTIKLEQLNEKQQKEEQSIRDSYLGKTAPVWMQDDAVSICSSCEINFNVFRRRHHCRACGKLVCKSCCKKAPLEYKDGKVERVCSKCHHIIVHIRSSSQSDSSCDHCKRESVNS